ncbi:DUF2249 domain-containing protein [Granulicoccus phenolivorans]|uniref:DUF2249 domain-containing protein n=1 Tax=Granulicoccus phenolivorans TaxID=266854 RepID=UPI00041F0EA3|nr:DUF2249 domain-containing protein [Granulicoccus phenolivorans]
MADIQIHRSREHASASAASGGCACGGHDEDIPELDVQTIPHAIRHAAIFGAVESLHPGGGLVISATHNPVPLLNQLADRHGSDYSTEYLTSGPERWRILIRRTQVRP